MVLLSVIGLMGLPDPLHTPAWASVGRGLHYGIMQSGGSGAPYRCSSCVKLLKDEALPWVLNLALMAEPFEDALSSSTTSLFKSIRYGIRRTLRFLRWSANRWAEWMLRALGFFILAVLAPLVNRDLLKTWREKGWDGLRKSVLLGVTVYMRLLLDSHAPLLGKLAIAFALAYCVASRDLVPDASFPLGALDDALAVVLASRGFILLCPESLVEAHAIRAARKGERLQAWRSRVPPPVG
jgi:uncharacterized membrane protein YkvA (DUF1232 family)